MWLALFLLRAAAPSDLLDNDQQRPAAYVVDAVVNGNWLCQRDWSGDIASKPPLYTWLAAWTAMAQPRVTLLALYWPSAAATLGIACLVLAAGTRWFSAAAGLLAALLYLLSPAAVKQLCLIRTDALFAFTVTLAALAAYSAWSGRRSWVWFWLAGAAAALTKGPLGVVLAAGGLLGLRREHTERRPSRGHLVGVGLFVLLCAGWFGLAYLAVGQSLIDKLIGRELVGHAVRGDTGQWPLLGFYRPPFYFLSRFFPWSLLACIGLVRVVRRPAQDAAERRFERFLAAWLCVGIGVFAVGPHHRADHLLPLLAPAALLASRELARWTHHRLPPLVVAVCCLAAVCATGTYYHLVRGRQPIVRQTARIEALAASVRERIAVAVPLLAVDSPYALQFHLNRMERQLSVAAADARLRATSQPLLLALQNQEAWREHAATPLDSLIVIAPAPLDGTPRVLLAANQQLPPAGHAPPPRRLSILAVVASYLLVLAVGARALLRAIRRPAY